MSLCVTSRFSLSNVIILYCSYIVKSILKLYMGTSQSVKLEDQWSKSGHFMPTFCQSLGVLTYIVSVSLGKNEQQMSPIVKRLIIKGILPKRLMVSIAI